VNNAFNTDIDRAIVIDFPCYGALEIIVIVIIIIHKFHMRHSCCQIVNL